MRFIIRKLIDGEPVELYNSRVAGSTRELQYINNSWFMRNHQGKFSSVSVQDSSNLDALRCEFIWQLTPTKRNNMVVSLLLVRFLFGADIQHEIMVKIFPKLRLTKTH